MRRGIATAAVVIAAMGLGRLITDSLPLADAADKPFFHAGAVGRAVPLAYADITVTGVHVTPTIMGNPASAAGGRWLVVDTAILARTAPTVMSGFFLVDAQDRRWIASTRGPDCATSTKLATGVPNYASICFDVPEQALTGARLMATRGAWDSHESTFRRDDVAEIDLGIEAAEVGALWVGKDAVNVRPSGPVPPESSPEPTEGKSR